MARNSKSSGRILVLNGRIADESRIRDMMHGLNDSSIRTGKGGYLFKSSADDEFLRLGIVPYFQQGQRNYHYDIALPESAECVLIGNLNPDGVFTLLFTPPELPLDDETRAGYAAQYRIFADELISRGFAGRGRLDDATRQMLRDSGIADPPPKILADIANL
jgi:hypothetical protein